jgi:hypothetical protein
MKTIYKKYKIPFVFYGEVVIEAEGNSDAEDYACGIIMNAFARAKGSVDLMAITLNSYKSEEAVELKEEDIKGSENEK